MADSIRKFDSKSNRMADLIRDSIRTQKNDSQIPLNQTVLCLRTENLLLGILFLASSLGKPAEQPGSSVAGFSGSEGVHNICLTSSQLHFAPDELRLQAEI